MRFISRKKTLIILQSLLLTQLSFSLSLEQVLLSVDEHFPLIQASYKDIMVARANLLAAQGGFDPTVQSNFILSPYGTYQNSYWKNEVDMPIANSGNQLFTGYRLGQGTFPVYDQDRWTYKLGEMQVGVDVPLLRNRSTDARRIKLQQSEIGIRLAKQNFFLKKISAEKDAAYSYWDWNAEGEKIKIQRQLLSLAENRRKLIAKRVSHGELPNLEITENERLIIQRETSLAMQKQYFQKSCYILSLYYRDNLGKPILANKTAIENFSHDHVKVNASLTHAKEELLDSNPRIKKLIEEQGLTQAKLSLAQNNILPKLNNRVYVAHDMGGGNPPLNRNSINFEIQFEMPLFQREAQGNIIATKTELEKIKINKKMLSEQIMADINIAKNQILLFQNIILMTQKELTLAQKLENAEDIKYNSGDSNLFQVNLREQVTAETKTRLITALADYHKALANYYYTIGKTQQ